MENTFEIQSLDHLVLTVSDIAQTVGFYTGVLGMSAEEFNPTDGSVRMALVFGRQKINLYQAGAEFEPKARHAGTGTADLCFLTETPVAAWVAYLSTIGAAIEAGPVRRRGAQRPILSIYLRDPDGNLIEISNALRTVNLESFVFARGP